MVPVLVLLTFAAFVALDYFVLSKGYLEETSGWPEKLESLPLPAAQERVPSEVFLQPTYTWSRLGDANAVYLGVHPLLLGLVGSSCEIDLLAQGDRVGKGEALARIGRGDRRLTVRSPIAGLVQRVNRRASGLTRWREAEGKGGPWLYRLQAERSAEEVPQWLSGEAALEWTRRQYRQLCAYLQSAVAADHLGTVMADGGELPDGILEQTDAGVWAGLEARFLAPPAMATRPGGRADAEDRE